MTEITRRSLLRTGATATAVAMVGVRPWDAASASAAAGAPVGPLRRSDYTGLTATDFAVAGVGGGSGARLTLASVGDVAGAAQTAALRGSEDAFVLAFTGDAGLDSGIHTFDHGQLGRFDLFISPVGADAEHGYEAVIDRSVGAPPSPPRAPESSGTVGRDEPTAAAARAVAPAPAPAPDDAPSTGAAPAPAATSSAPQRAVAPLRSPKILRAAALRRLGRGARVDLTLLSAAHAKVVRVRLERNGKVVARATHAVRDRRVSAVLRTTRALPAGRYTLVVTAVTAAGTATTQRRRLMVR